MTDGTMGTADAPCGQVRRPGWKQAPFVPVDAAGTGLFRILFGAVMLWEMIRFLYYGWIESDYLALSFHFTYHGFEWVRPWPDPAMHVQLAVMTAAAAGLMLGLFSRLSAAVFFLGYTHLFLIETTYYQNHCYLICLLSGLMIFIPAQRAFSLDAWRRSRRVQPAAGEKRSGGGIPKGIATVPAWGVWLLRFQIAVPYFYGGLAKLEGDWLHGVQMKMMLSRSAEESWPGLSDLLTRPATVWGFTWGGLLFDLLIVPALLWRRTRVPACLLAVLFHLTNAAFLEIGIFPWLMIGATTIFFDPDWPRRLFRQGRTGSRAASAPPRTLQTTDSAPQEPPSKRRSIRLTLILLTLYVAWQVLFPFRHWLYPGPAGWTEEGHRFAWRMKLGFKTAMLPQFYAVDPVTGESHPLAYEGNLSLQQLELMAGHPDMLLQFSHFLADELKQMGYPRMNVHVITAVSYNGRKPQPIVDPAVDLSARRRTLSAQPWILPLEEPRRDVPWDWGQQPIGR